ncbi:MAG TPA: hypothetical protein VFS43_18865 [Polyangiaceae bacterium]|nr:hypothetical protein [Polyangiaceae bacterium]
MPDPPPAPPPPLSPPARRRAARLALAVPSLTLLAATAALLVGASPRGLVAARVYGGPSRGPGPHALRLACARYAVGVEDPVALEGLAVAIGGQTLPAACDGAGHGDLALPAGLALPERPAIEVRRGDRTLARGVADVSTQAWQRAFTARPARVPVAASPGPPFELLVDGGALAVGQRSRAWLRGRAADLSAPPRALGFGAEAGAPAPLGGGGGWAFDLRATFVQASVSLAPGPGEGGERWQAEASLPVIAGAPVVEALASEGGRLRAIVRSPSGRGDAYARVVDREGRRDGALVPLSRRSPEGWPEGEWSAPAPPPGAPAWLIVSASVDGGPALALPLPPGGEPRDGAFVPDALWVDGLAPARAAEAARLGRARWAVAALVASGALLEAWLLVWLQRARALVTGEPAGERIPLRPLRSGWLALALGVVWLAFVIIGILLGAGLG